MALKNVADTPFVANVSHELTKAGAHLKKVPLTVWRFGIIALASVWMCFALAKLFWLLMPRPEIPTAPVVPVKAEASSAGATSDVDLAALQELGLFGDFDAEAIAQTQSQTAPENRPITDLNLELQGLIAADEPTESWAIIGKAGGEQRLYKIDDEIEGMRGVKVAEVHDLKVVLSNNGRLEDLWLYGEDGKSFAASAANYTPPVQSSPPDSTRSAEVSQSQLQEAKNIGDVVRFVVATENGKMIGYKVRPGRKRALFDQVGLKADDVVVSVNGIEVNEPQKIREVYQALKNASQADLQILRDGVTQSITITMGQ